ncbi:hypothetical protein JL722_14844 [Aureococcus anophagefferens]|nr:hypothetical protein JL722_14844 [Aureococcus anophagefferens]
MSTLVSSTTTTAAAAASNAATLYALLLEKCGPAAAAAAGWAQERYLLFVDAAVLRFDDGLALLDPAQANYVRDVAAASQDVVASLARFLASLRAAYASALKLAEKSRVAASALPHALYVAAVLGGRRAFRTVRRRPRSPRLASLVLVARLYGADAALRKWAAAQSDEPNPEPPPPSPPASPPASPARDEPEGAAASTTGRASSCGSASPSPSSGPSPRPAPSARRPCLAEPRRAAGELAFAALAAIAGRWAPPDDRPPPPSPRARAAATGVARRGEPRAAATLAPGTLLETALGDRYAGLRDHVAEVASDADGWRGGRRLPRP